DHWRKNIPVLAESHRVFSIDLIGYGYSDKPNPRELGDSPFYTFETWGSQLNDFCREVVKDEAFFICNSIGGLVGLQAAVADPTICKGVMLLNISLRMLHITKQPWNTPVGKFFFQTVATREAVRNILCQCPVLVVWGDKDPWEPIELGRAYGNFDSVEDFVALPGVGHCPQDEAPHLVNPLVESFAARHATVKN
nr:pheophytinase, chloroplastic isoform X2 [Tanacetum cinerariifolium]